MEAQPASTKHIKNRAKKVSVSFIVRPFDRCLDSWFAWFKILAKSKVDYKANILMLFDFVQVWFLRYDFCVKYDFVLEVLKKYVSQNRARYILRLQELKDKA